MGTRMETKFEIKSWDEQPFQELPEGQKLSRASVALASTGAELEGEATMSTLLHYRADGTSTFGALLHINGRLDQHTGGFVLHGTGTYDGTQARVAFTVVPGSGTGELAEIRGSAASVSTHDDYPFMPITLDYQIG